jgi:hypothetical protein
MNNEGNMRAEVDGDNQDVRSLPIASVRVVANDMHDI